MLCYQQYWYLTKNTREVGRRTEGRDSNELLMPLTPRRLVVMKWTRPLCGSAAISQNDFKTSAIIHIPSDFVVDSYPHMLRVDQPLISR